MTIPGFPGFPGAVDTLILVPSTFISLHAKTQSKILFMSNMIQIFLMPLIMIGQNLQSQHAETRAEIDFEINKKAEMEIETVLMHLENQNQLIQKILYEVEQNGFHNIPPKGNFMKAPGQT